MKKRILDLFILLAIAAWIVVVAVGYHQEKTTCHGQCHHHQDSGCQDRCFSKEFCPHPTDEQ
jgi:hypothetical protein